MIQKIVNNKFDEVEQAEVAIVDFSATWCGPCKMLAPVMEELSEEWKDKVSFFNADVDENMELAERFEIASIPALVLFKNGKRVDMQVGFQPKSAVGSWLQSQM